MKNSVLLRRIILLLLTAVLLSGILSAAIYIFITQRMYVQMRADELLPIARMVADMMADTQMGGEDRMNWPLLERDNREFLGALLHIYDDNGQSVMNPPRDGDKGKESKSEEDYIAQMIDANLDAVLAGGEVSEICSLPGSSAYLVVGVPIESGDTVTGAVIFTKSISELSDAMSGMNLTLIVSTLAAFLIMLIPGYLMAKKITVPIRRMGEVARAMARGDFSVRADESQKGEIGELGRSMNHFAVESERLEQTRRDYVANVSHELRTPIAAIRAMGETLRDGMAKSEEKQKMFYNNIVRESMRLSRLVDDLLELSRLQSGVAAMQKTQFDLREVIENVADTYSYLAAESGLEFALAADMDKAIPAFSSPDRVEQVLIILLDNAIKHTPVGGTVTLHAAKKGGRIEMRVSDTGEGIPQEDIPYIFERFYKVDKSHSGRGTGLGLSIAQEIIRGLGESVWVESDTGGTSFFLTVGCFQ